ncbi:MAG: glycohydrolase toxin TNT-related protein [Syntrophomonas sp.]
MKRKSGIFILLTLVILIQVFGSGLALSTVDSSSGGSSTSADPLSSAVLNPTVEVLADSSSITVKVNGKAFDFSEQSPYISNSRTMVPLSFVSQALGASVKCDDSYIMISTEEPQKHIQLRLGERAALFNGGQILIETAPEIKAGTTMVPVSFISQALGAEVKYIKITRWTDKDGNIKWPANDGFKGESMKMTLQPGSRIDRYGSEYGTFVCPEGVSYEMRSLAPGSETKPYNVYEVQKPVEVLSGEIAPWFDQPGGGIQYMFDKSIRELIEAGILIKVG